MATNGNGALGLAEAAKAVGASDSTLRRMIRQGRLKADKKRVGGREKLLINRYELLAAFGRPQDLAEGAGSVVKLRGHDQARDPGQTVVTPDQGEAIRVLQGELSKREHALAGLNAELKELRAELASERAEVRRLNAELLALLKQERPGASEPRSLMRRILGL